MILFGVSTPYLVLAALCRGRVKKDEASWRGVVEAASYEMEAVLSSAAATRSFDFMIALDE